jgi:methionine aminotransferase
MNLRSKLPNVGTTIFTVMTERARQLGAINLAQGFPDYEPPDALKQLLSEQVWRGPNQYSPMIGATALREQIALKLAASYGRMLDAEQEITITLGATEGIFSGISALVHPGEQALVFDPSYDSYAPAIVLAGGEPVHIPLQPPHFRIDWQRVREAINPRLRLVIINSPHNPTGTVLSAADLDELAAALRGTDALVLSDEVYEHMVFDERSHASVLGHPELFERAICVFSFGKTMHATGWRVGYAVAPRALTAELRRVHQFNTFSIATPLQHAIADFLKQAPEHNQGLTRFYQHKRDFFLERLRGSRFSWIASEGTFFQLLDFSSIASAGDLQFAETLLHQAGVACIPISPFYAAPPPLSVVRFCFAKSEATLQQAAEKLCSM